MSVKFGLTPGHGPWAWGWGGSWWARQGSNLRPSACKADALPLSYAPDTPEGVRVDRVPCGAGWSEINRAGAARTGQDRGAEPRSAAGWLFPPAVASERRMGASAGARAGYGEDGRA